jgi:hypothetical protein
LKKFYQENVERAPINAIDCAAADVPSPLAPRLRHARVFITPPLFRSHVMAKKKRATKKKAGKKAKKKARRRRRM